MRTEEQVLKDFEKLGFRVIKFTTELILKSEERKKDIIINFNEKDYSCSLMRDTFFSYITMQEHKLLTELFTIWGWL